MDNKILIEEAFKNTKHNYDLIYSWLQDAAKEIELLNRKLEKCKEQRNKHICGELSMLHSSLGYIRKYIKHLNKELGEMVGER